MRTDIIGISNNIQLTYYFLGKSFGQEITEAPVPSPLFYSYIILIIARVLL